MRQEMADRGVGDDEMPFNLHGCNTIADGDYGLVVYGLSSIPNMREKRAERKGHRKHVDGIPNAFVLDAMPWSVAQMIPH